jgi:hypothetical protein
MPGMQLPGGPFIQIEHDQDSCRLEFTQYGSYGYSNQLYECSPAQMLEQADAMAELAGAMRDQANRALDFTAELQEMSRG